MSLILALMSWLYISDEVRSTSEDEKQFLSRIIPARGLAAKNVSIKTIFVGQPRPGFFVDERNIAISPEYCIVVGSKEILGKLRFAYTAPIDITGANKTFTKSVSLNPIAPGIYMGDTLVQVTVPVEKSVPQ